MMRTEKWIWSWGTVACLAAVACGSSAAAGAPTSNAVDVGASAEAGRIVYVEEGGPEDRIISIAPDGSDPVEVYRAEPGTFEEPALSPDGSTVTFTTDLGGNVHIFAVNADGSGGLAQVTSGSGFEFGSSWSPDGTKLVVDAEGSFDGPGGVAIVDVATGEMTPITSNPCGGFDAHPRFSPDGTQVLFVRGRCEKADSAAIFVLNVDDPHPKRITAWGLGASEPDWSPDGSLIAFNTFDERITHAEIYVIAPDGTGLRRLTSEPGAAGVFRPSWSPEGSRLVFTLFTRAEGMNIFDLYTMSGDGTDVMQITDTSALSENQADWA
jgi:Tol biopolymer transport system component